MLFPPTTSFTPLSTISLPTSRLLHPRACNPAMDLVVLLSPYPAPTSTLPVRPWSAKGKGKEEGQTKVGLWRTSGGSAVWEVEVTGRVAGFAWMEDGLHISLLLVSNTHKSVDTLSVHTGETVKSMPLKLEVPDLADGQWVEMTWNDTGLKWEAPRNGSALMVVESLPRVTPVEPPKPANVLPFMRPVAAALPKQTLHPILQDFPSLLPSKSPIAPTMLQISTQQPSSAYLLNGTLSLASDPTPAVLELAQIADQMVTLFDTVLRGLENAEAAFREGEKQTMICREDLETCAKQQATSIPDVHADLFRHLITGRTGIAVTEWLGNRMTGRTITKWDSTLDTAFRTIQKLISESISPALERLMLLLEQVTGWTKTPSYCEQLNLDKSVLKQAQDLVGGFAIMAENMRRHAEHEMLAAAEFMDWLRYETMRVVNQERSMLTETPTGHNDGQLWLIHTPSSADLPSRISALALSDADDSTTCLALQFFDDEELVLLLEEARAQQRYLVTVRYTDILDSMGTVPEGMEWTYRELVEMGRREIGENMPVVPITRSRPLSSERLLINGQMESPKPANVSIALNGRTGRRLGCVMLDAEEGKEIEVLDLEVDEDAYEEDDIADDDEPEERWSADGDGEVTM
ncbi:hypothetical protein IAT38_006816 [Cryptococcus sp. DSM 104549]